MIITQISTASQTYLTIDIKRMSGLCTIIQQLVALVPIQATGLYFLHTWYKQLPLTIISHLQLLYQYNNLTKVSNITLTIYVFINKVPYDYNTMEMYLNIVWIVSNKSTNYVNILLHLVAVSISLILHVIVDCSLSNEIKTYILDRMEILIIEVT